MGRDLLRQMKSQPKKSLFVLSLDSLWQRVGDIKTAFRAALRRSGLIVKGYRFHDIRRTIARMLYNQGVILTKIQRLLGHKSVLTTERDLGLIFEETREAVLSLDGLLSQAMSIAANSKPIIQLPETMPETIRVSIN